MSSRCFFYFAVGVGDFVIGWSHISSLLSVFTGVLPLSFCVLFEEHILCTQVQNMMYQHHLWSYRIIIDENQIPLRFTTLPHTLRFNLRIELRTDSYLGIFLINYFLKHRSTFLNTMPPVMKRRKIENNLGVFVGFKHGFVFYVIGTDSPDNS